MSKLQPAYGIIKDLGGSTEVAAALGIDRSAVWRWTQPKAKGGTNGTVPHWYVARLLEFARDKDKPLTAARFAPVVNVPASPAHSDMREAV
ncbi:hypothetical protein [Methylobacterium sp.]|uniref:hypothetical protein n=1 Tax=Methylobacterium sp. TaxID=409 RepID=UPI000C4C6897|nr:hypothetical protein [Methylobacterium sp.]MBP30457.1 hypothetical protein [Methylobacterium sp.]